MQKRKFSVRVFKCPDCGNKMYAPKRISRMTVPGHKKPCGVRGAGNFRTWNRWSEVRKNVHT